MAEFLDAKAIANPDWLLAAFTPDHDAYHFAQVDRRTYSQSPFLDHRISPVPSRVASAEAAMVEAGLAGLSASTTDRPATWILHTAFCASTLLASCLDRPGSSLVLKEPLVLSRLAQEKRAGGDGLAEVRGNRLWKRHAQRVIGLCERTYGDERVVVKPSNFANSLATELGDEEAGRQRQFVLMSSSLVELLVSVVKKREEADRLMPGFLTSLLQDSDYLNRVGLAASDGAIPGGLDLLQQSVLFWHCQRYQLQNFLESQAASQVHSLTMQQFFQSPGPCLDDVVAFSGLPMDAEAIDEAVAGKVQASHSKDQGSAYSPEHHRAEAQDIIQQNRETLESAIEWAFPILDRLAPVPFSGEDDPVGTLS